MPNLPTPKINTNNYNIAIAISQRVAGTTHYYWFCTTHTSQRARAIVRHLPQSHPASAKTQQNRADQKHTARQAEDVPPRPSLRVNFTLRTESHPPRSLSAALFPTSVLVGYRDRSVASSQDPLLGTILVGKRQSNSAMGGALVAAATRGSIKSRLLLGALLFGELV